MIAHGMANPPNARVRKMNEIMDVLLLASALQQEMMSLKTYKIHWDAKHSKVAYPAVIKDL